MAKEGTEGESYLDQLLNTVAPDWEDTSSTPDHSLAESIEDVSLDDALAMLNDLPDSEEEISGNLDENMEELFELLASMPENEEENIPEPEVVLETPVPDFEPEEAFEMDADEVLEVDFKEPEVTASEAIEPEAIEPEETELEEAHEEQLVSSEGVDMEDIFQDALSAVAYSEKEEDMSEPESEDIFSLDEMAEFMEEDPMAAVSSIPVTDLSEVQEKEEKAGFFQRIFGNIITEQTAEEEEKERQAEQEEKEKRAAERDEKKKLAEKSKEEKEKQSQEQKERKKILKAEKARKKAEKQEEKKRRKEEMAAEQAKEVVGKLNPIGTTIVIVFFITIGIFTAFGSYLLHRTTALTAAENYYANGEFIRAYDEICGVKLQDDDQQLYDRIRMCSQMQKEWNSYNNYTKMEMHLEALDSLMKGIRYYDIHKEKADALGAMGALNSLESQIAANLYDVYGLSETQAREILEIEDQAEYTKRLEQIVRRVQAVTDNE